MVYLRVVIGIIFTLFAATCYADMPTRATTNDVDWLNGLTSLENVEEYAWRDGDQYAHGNVPCQYQTAFKFGHQSNGWNSPIIKTSSSNCATAGMTINVASGNKLAIANDSTIWQTINTDSLPGANLFPNSGTDGMAVITTQQSTSGTTRQLHYTKDWPSVFGTFLLDNSGNVIRSQSKPLEYEFSRPDGSPITDIYTSGLSFSANGRWMYIGANTTGRFRINTSDFSVVTFAQGRRPTYSVSTSISNSGRYIAEYARDIGLTVYDLNSCLPEQMNLASQNCAKRSLTSDIEQQYRATLSDPTKLTQFSIVSLKFKGESALEMYVYVQDGVSHYKKMLYKLVSDPEPLTYLALGDSFSSGEGVYNYRSVTNFYADADNYNLCHQSLSSYPYLLSASVSPVWFGSVACSGAKQKDIFVGTSNPEEYYIDGQPQARMSNINPSKLIKITEQFLPGYIPQKSHIDPKLPSVTTVSIGGNDIGFGDIVTACIVNKFFRNWESCNTLRADREQIANTIDQQIPQLSATLRAVKQSLSGDQKLYVVGYPKIINYTNELCPLNTPMKAQERQFADNLTEYLNEALRIATAHAGGRFLDMSSAFVNSDYDYRLCGSEGTKAANGLIVARDSTRGPNEPVARESFHPNAFGHKLMANQIRMLTNDFELGMPEATLTSTVPASSFRTRLVGDAIITNPDQRVNYIADSVPSLIVSGISQTIKLASDKIQGVFINQVTAQVELHSEPINIGELVISTDKTAEGVIAIPRGVPAGYHQLHVLYTDSAGQKHDLYKYVLVANSSEDYDGDGVKNINESCVIGEASGVDIDQDGIDDACDGEYVRTLTSPVDNDDFEGSSTSTSEGVSYGPGYIVTNANILPVADIRSTLPHEQSSEQNVLAMTSDNPGDTKGEIYESEVQSGTGSSSEPSNKISGSVYQLICVVIVLTAVGAIILHRVVKMKKQR